MDPKMISTIIFEVGRNPKAAENMVCLAKPLAGREGIPIRCLDNAIEYVVGLEACAEAPS
jgi:hypothetical protein